MTATPGRRNFSGRTPEETRKGIGIDDLGGQKGKPQAVAVVGKSKIMIETSSDCAKKQKDGSVDDNKLPVLESRVL